MSRGAREWSRAPNSNSADKDEITMKTKTNIKAGLEDTDFTHQEMEEL